MSDFNCKLVRDSRINDISTQISFGVHKGASNNTFQSFPAIAVSDSMVNVSVQCPSENIIIDRNILIDTDVSFTLGVSGSVPSGSKCIEYGLNESLQAFPFNSLVSSSNCTINDTNVTVQLQEVLPVLLRLNSSRELCKWNGLCPSLPDQGYKKFSDMAGTPQNPLGDFSNSGYDSDLLPRGSHPIEIVAVRHYRSTAPNTPHVYTSEENAIALYLISTNLADRWEIDFKFHTTEPLIGLSPWTMGGEKFNSQGLPGINGLNFVWNIDSTCKRLFSSASPYPMTLKLGATPFSGFKLLVNFLSAQPSDLINPKNVLPYVSFPRYISSNNGLLNPGQTLTYTSQTVQLSQIPDYFILCARRPMGSQTCKHTSSFLPISKIDITFNNMSGILASATQQDLFRLSKKNGSTQNWYEFSGYANRCKDGLTSTVSTTGSLLMLNPAYDMSLPEYLSSSSIGQFTFQYNIRVTNNDSDAYQPELMLICVNSGVFTTVSGQSSIKSGLLTKELVMNCTMNEGSNTSSSAIINEMQGGSMRFNSVYKKMPGDVIKFSKGGAMSGGGHIGNLADMC